MELLQPYTQLHWKPQCPSSSILKELKKKKKTVSLFFGSVAVLLFSNSNIDLVCQPVSKKEFKSLIKNQECDMNSTMTCETFLINSNMVYEFWTYMIKQNINIRNIKWSRKISLTVNVTCSFHLDISRGWSKVLPSSFLLLPLSVSLSLPDSDGNVRVGELPSGFCTSTSTSI